ncbi:hypothetical protein M8J76_005340 [Diaphorina citri]|nr:hypothetical protein M8J75_011883 [Diaphorina citri]KAI5744805.1 hypothetical protein M8J76_005340 [Diaphorina citri]
MFIRTGFLGSVQIADSHVTCAPRHDPNRVSSDRMENLGKTDLDRIQDRPLETHVMGLTWYDEYVVFLFSHRIGSSGEILLNSGCGGRANA